MSFEETLEYIYLEFYGIDLENSDEDIDKISFLNDASF